MSFVNLVSGGLDSTLIGVMAKEDHIDHFPLFIDYGQRATAKEWATCQAVHRQLGLPEPTRMDLSGFGQVIASGLTNVGMDVKEDAFTPGRNMLFLLMGSAYAYQVGASSIAIGLLAEQFSLFDRCSVTLVYLTDKTASSKWVNWEIEESLKRGKGVIGVYKGGTPPAKTPPAFQQNRCKAVKWEHAALSAAIEDASTKR